MKRKAMVVLWPAFLVAGVGTVMLFSALDPVDLRFVGPFELEQLPGYTIGFFFLWALTAASSALTSFLERSPADVNRPRAHSGSL